MPYVKPHTRRMLDPIVEEVVEILTSVVPKEAYDGALNYVFTKLLREVLIGRPTYLRLERAVGILECCKLELYRRAAAPYEDKKIAENGDVYE